MTSSLSELKQLKEVVTVLLDYSKAAIIKDNFIKNFYENTHNGYLHGSYTLGGAKSFRLTSNSPNMLNMPSTGSVYAKPIKKCFEAKEGYIIYTVDFSALEDRIMANLSKDKNKCSIFLEGIDGHCLNSYYYWKEDIEHLLPRKEGENTYDYVKRYKNEVEHGNKALKAIRQKSKRCTFGLSYGCYPPKVASNTGCSLKEAEQIFNRYHNELYPAVSALKDKVLKQIQDKGKLHLGLGYYLRSDNPQKEIRTLNNACCQFWSILSLIAVHDFNEKLQETGYDKYITIISTIYDSIYLHVTDDVKWIKYVNDTLIPIMLIDPFEDTIVYNEAEGAIGYNWYDLVPIKNNASLLEIRQARQEALQKFKENL